jgi:hypothetical protein
MQFRRSFIDWLRRVVAQGAERLYRKERQLLPEHRIEGVPIYGNAAFVQDVSEAFQRLRNSDPHGYSLVQRYTRAVVQSQLDPEKGVPIGVVYCSADGNGRLQGPADRFAAALVRRAVARRKLVGFNIWRSPRSALGSLNRELRAMRLLGVDPKYFHAQSNKILQMEKLIEG